MRLLQIASIASLAMVLASVEANAAVFIGSTEGCFGVNCTVHTTASDHNLSFTGASFSVSDGTQFTLGSFTLKDSSLFGGHIFNNESFDLHVDFSQPSNAGALNLLADVTGFISVLGGIVSIDFNPSSVAFGNSAYVLDVNNLLLGTSFFTGKDVEALTGTINLASPSVGPSSPGAVPEPSTWVMMLVGFSALAFFGRRFRSASNVAAV
jgi:hypothetical protein